MEEVLHGVNGWTLVEYDWNNGDAFFRYERHVEVLGSDERVLEVYECRRQQ